MQADSFRKLWSVCLIFVALPIAAQAAGVTWQTPQTISGVSDVSTVGSLVAAWSWGNPSASSVTVNGVTFANLTWTGSGSQSGSNLTVLSSGDPWITSEGVYGSSSSPFDLLDANYKNILSGAAESLYGGTEMTLSGLTIGVDYEIQFWVNDSSTTEPNAQYFDGSGTSEIFSYNTSSAIGGVGQFIKGTFTANGTTQNLNLYGNLKSQLNAGQIRAIPEPATAALLAGGLGLVAFLIGRKRRIL